MAIGITDWMSLSGGISLIPVPGFDSQLYYGNIKLTPVRTEKFDFSFGGLIMGIEKINFGVVYGVGTWGNNNNGFSLGLGYDDNGFAGTPLLMIGGEVRISNSSKFITDNWISDEFSFFSFGIRFFGEHIAGDFGFITNQEMLSPGSYIPGIPWLGFTYNFGGNN